MQCTKNPVSTFFTSALNNMPGMRQYSLLAFSTALQPVIDNDTTGDDHGRMDTQVTKLEETAEQTAERLAVIERDVATSMNRLTVIENHVATCMELLTLLERDVAVIKSNYSTKADVLDAKASIIMWVVSAIFLAQLLPGLLKHFGMQG